jgi:hypothetical protein
MQWGKDGFERIDWKARQLTRDEMLDDIVVTSEVTGKTLIACQRQCRER